MPTIHKDAPLGQQFRDRMTAKRKAEMERLVKLNGPTRTHPPTEEAL
jgi:hypothetical protein